MNGCITPTDNDGYISNPVWRKDGIVHDVVREGLQICDLNITFNCADDQANRHIPPLGAETEGPKSKGPDCSARLAGRKWPDG